MNKKYVGTVLSLFFFLSAHNSNSNGTGARERARERRYSRYVGQLRKGIDSSSIPPKNQEVKKPSPETDQVKQVPKK